MYAKTMSAHGSHLR